jgi:predicted enzyme related to lactoylglutathione lyase
MAKRKAVSRKPAARSKSRTKPGAKKASVKKRTAAAPALRAAPPKPTGPSVVHWEVQARDPAAQQRFFAELFEWKIDASNPMSYGVVAAAGNGSIGGGIGAMSDAPRATFYVQVPDINAALAKVESLGGQTVMPRQDMGMVIMAQFRDPEGNVIGLVEG